MSRPLAPLDISEPELDELRKLATSVNDLELARRARIILRCCQGRPSKDVAAKMGLSQMTVSKWRARFCKSGLQGLRHVHRKQKPTPAGIGGLRRLADRVTDIAGFYLNPPDVCLVVAAKPIRWQKRWVCAGGHQAGVLSGYLELFEELHRCIRAPDPTHRYLMEEFLRPLRKNLLTQKGGSRFEIVLLLDDWCCGKTAEIERWVATWQSRGVVGRVLHGRMNKQTLTHIALILLAASLDKWKSREAWHPEPQMLSHPGKPDPTRPFVWRAKLEK